MPDEMEPASPAMRELKLETARLERDIKAAELRQKNWDFDHPPTSFRSVIRSPVVTVGVFAALATLVGTVLTYMSAISQRETDRQKLEVETILEMIKTSSPDKAADNLKFAIDAGIIQSNAPNIQTYLKNRPRFPGAALPPPEGKP
jgi:hypothetical protein